MEASDKNIEAKKEKLKEFLKEPINLGVVLVIAFAAILRIYYFLVAKNQAHWWDSLAFGSIAMNMIYHWWDGLNFIVHEESIRPPLLSIIWSFFLRLGIGDGGTIFILEIVPSILSVWLVYKIGRELYDKRVGLLAGAIASAIWIHIFYSVRMMTEAPALFLALLSIYYFLKSYDTLELKKFSLSIFLISLAILMRYNYGVIGLTYVIFLGIVKKHHVLMKKNFWIGGLIGIIPILILFAFNFFHAGSVFPAAGEYVTSAAAKPGPAYYVFSFISYTLKNVFLICFLLGSLVILGELAIGYNLLTENKRLRSHLLLALIGILTLFFFIFVIKAAEDRYLLMMAPAMFIGGALFLDEIYKKAGNYKIIAGIVILAILLFGIYSNVVFANKIIEEKKTSFLPMKQAFLWIKENTPENSVIIGDWADPYAIYYSKRKVTDFPSNLTELEGFFPDADYITLTAVHQPTPEVVNYVNKKAGEGLFTPVHAEFFDSAGKQPAVIVYRINKNGNLNS